MLLYYQSCNWKYQHWLSITTKTVNWPRSKIVKHKNMELWNESPGAPQNWGTTPWRQQLHTDKGPFVSPVRPNLAVSLACRQNASPKRSAAKGSCLQDRSGVYTWTAGRGTRWGALWQERARKEHHEQTGPLFQKRQQKDSAHSLRSLSTNVLFSRFPGSCKLVFTIDAVRSEAGWGPWKPGEGTPWGTVPTAPPAAAEGLVWSYLNKTHSKGIRDTLVAHASHAT